MIMSVRGHAEELSKIFGSVEEPEEASDGD